jgi:hypothetical protein
MKSRLLFVFFQIVFLIILLYLPVHADDYRLQIKNISHYNVPAVMVDVYGNYAFFPSWDENVSIFDISFPANPIHVGTIAYQNAVSAAAAGNIACLDHSTYLSFWDISDISNPVYLSQISMNSDRCDDIKIVGHYVLAAIMHKVIAIDFSDPLHPFEAGSITPRGNATLLKVRGNLALLADSYDLTILDVSEPANMQILSEIISPMTCVDADFFEDYAVYTAYAEENNFLIANIHDPRNPFIASQLRLPGYATYVRVLGNFAFVLLWDSGLIVVDISDPLNPSVVAYDSTEIVYDLDNAGNNILATTITSIAISALSPLCTGIAGDANGDGHFNGLDVVYDVNFLKGTGHPVCPTYCSGYTSPVYREADANGNCQFNGIDITYAINFLKGGPPLPEICPDCPE